MQIPIKIFVVYAHEDKPVRDKLLRQLRPLADKGEIDLWSDHEIKPGALWDEEIRVRLTESEIILLLVSDDFFASDYIRRVEFETALELQTQGKTRILPVIARHCGWADLPSLSRLQVLPPEGRPVLSKEWDSPDEPYLKIYEGVKSTAREMRRKLATRKPPEEMPSLPLAKAARNRRWLIVGVVLILAVAVVVWQVMFGPANNQKIPDTGKSLQPNNMEANKTDKTAGITEFTPGNQPSVTKENNPPDRIILNDPKRQNKSLQDLTKTAPPLHLPVAEQDTFRFDRQDEPVEGMRRVLKDHKFGFVNVTTGEFIGWYDDAENFQKIKGAYVKQNGLRFWIDKTGRCIDGCH